MIKKNQCLRWVSPSLNMMISTTNRHPIISPNSQCLDTKMKKSTLKGYEEFSRELGSVYISAVPELHNENDVRIAKERILERRKKDLGIETTDKSKPSSSMLIKCCF